MLVVVNYGFQYLLITSQFPVPGIFPEWPIPPILHFSGITERCQELAPDQEWAGCCHQSPGPGQSSQI